MRFWFSYYLTFILLGFVFAIVYYIVSPYRSLGNALIAPVPDFLILTNNRQVSLLDMWKPEETFASMNGNFQIEGKSALVYDITHNKVIYEKNAHERLPMASLTKIMTAVIALEDKGMPEAYTVHGEDLVGEDSMGLSAGEKLSKEELLYGLMLNSGNDAAEVLAHNFIAGRYDFIAAMYNKARVLGMNNTKFSNPTGLQGDGEQYSTAYDLLVLTKYVLENYPLFKRIVSTYQYTIPASNTHKEYELTNETNLLSTYPGVKGVKTGYTPEAGMCLITYYEKDGISLIAILLNSPNRREEMKKLLDYSLTSFGIHPPKVD